MAYPNKRRYGRGRKPMYNEAMTRINVMLDADTVARAAALGGGNLSAGLRLAVAAVARKSPLELGAGEKVLWNLDD